MRRVPTQRSGGVARRRGGRVVPSLASAVAFAAILAAAVPAFANAAASGLRVERSDREAVRVALTAPAPTWRAHELGGGLPTLYEPVLEGFAAEAAPGRPRLPVTTAWLVVPPGTRPVLRAVRESWNPAPPHRLLVGATPIVPEEGAGERPWLVEELVLPGESPRRGASALDAETAARLAVPEAAPASLGPVVPWRGRRIVPLAVRPVAADASGRASRALAEGVWEVRFEPDPAVARTAADPRAKRTARGDLRFAGLFLNGEALREWTTEAAAGERRETPLRSVRARAPQLLAPEIRLPVARTRLYRVGAAGLRAAGLLDGATVAESQVRLYQRRYDPAEPGLYASIEVPLLMVGEGDEFADDDYFLFYGLRPRDDGPFVDGGGVPRPGCGDPEETYNPNLRDEVNSGNIYFLAFADPEPGGDPWARMGETSFAAAVGTPLPSYRRVDFFEEDGYYAHQPFDAFVDRNHYNSIYQNQARVPLSPVAPAPGAVDARLRCGLYGYAPGVWRFLGVSLEHDLGGELLGELRVDSAGGIFVREALPSTLLGQPGLELVVDNTGSTLMLGYLDWIELSYESLYVARDDALEFHGGDAAGLRDIEVGGFSVGDLSLFEVTDPRAPLRVSLSPANVRDDGGEYVLSLSVPQDAGARRFVARAGDPTAFVPDFPYITASVVDAAPELLDPASPPDMIVVCHPEFREALQPWIDYRIERSGGSLVVQVADVHAVYDRFSGGVKHPDAIRRYARHALAEWGTWALQLVGDANENVRGLNGGAPPEGQRDWVPSHLHRWRLTGYPTEMLPSDKWFAMPDPGDDYPLGNSAVAEMLVGRFPCNSPAELTTMIGKVRTFETAAGDWKRRAIFIADDQWSSGAYDITGTTNVRNPGEYVFEQTEDQAATWWEELAGVGHEAVRVFLSDYLEPHLPEGATTRDLNTYKDYTETEITIPVLLPQMGAGAMLVHYQGHANDHLLAHEQVIEDMVGGPNLRQDVQSLANRERPWVFMGLGCHVVSFTLDGAGRPAAQVPSLGEKLLFRSGGGACAVYASPGYEFRDTNADFATTQFDGWLHRPPRDGLAGEGRSRWLLGEMMLQAEAAMIAARPTYTTYQLLVAQYALLGDPLMVLDGGPPSVSVARGAEVLADGDELSAGDASNLVALTVEGRDEAGVDRIEIVDSLGEVLTGLATGGTPEGAPSDQYVVYDLPLPVRPFDHEISIRLYDTADPTAGAVPAVFTLRLPLTAALFRDGQPIEPGAAVFAPGVPQSFTAQVTTAAWLGTETALELRGRNLSLSGVVAERTGPHAVDLAFTAVLEPAKGLDDLSVILLVDGYETEIVLQGQGGEVPPSEITQLNAFPNPAPGETRFVFRTGADPVPGRITIYTVSGRPAATVPVSPSHFGGGAVIVPWNGRDGADDRLANGVYLYRVELDVPGARVRSDMQRLVVMR